MKRIVLIGGPTGSGKNRLSLALAQQVPSEIVNADSRQIYQDLQIGTNRPSPEEMEGIPHHLFGFHPPAQRYTVADYEKDSGVIVNEILARGKVAILTGGTGFYFKAFLRGGWPVPAVDPALRKRLRDLEQKRTKMFLYRMLQRVDPVSAQRIPPNDSYRVGRALEIYFQSGRKRSDLAHPRPERYEAVKVFVHLGREPLKEILTKRLDEMLRRGWADEVRNLMQQYPGFESMPAGASLGYPEMIRFVRGDIPESEMKQEILRKTVQYARRQLTWFRNQDGFQPLDASAGLHKMAESVLQLL